MMRNARGYPLVGALLIAAVAGMVAMATYVMVTNAGGMWDMQGMHERMMNGGRDTSGSQPTQGSSRESVDIRDFAFWPGNLVVPVGATATWTNYDSALHSATASDGTWDTGILNKGENGPVTFSRAGSYPYYCSLHPDMKALITVR
jgi:plastocyanin